MAEAIEAGMRGEATEATQRLGMSDSHDAGARRHRRHAGAAAHDRGPEPARACSDTVPPARATHAPAATSGDAARRAARRRRWGTFLALLARLAAVAIVAIALLVARRATAA